MKSIVFAALITLSVPLSSLLAQEPPSAKPATASAPQNKHFYRLDFTVKQIESGRTINSRNYSAIFPDGRKQTSIRAGSKIPFKTGQDIQLLNVGVNIDCLSLLEIDGQVSLEIKAEISSVAVASQGASPDSPTIRENVWQSNVTIPLRKATTIFSSDDLASKQTMQLEVMAVPIK